MAILAGCSTRRGHRDCDVDGRRRIVHIVDTVGAKSVPGAQSVARAARLLRLVTSAGDEGFSVAELAQRADLTRPTAHRLLSALRHEGLVDQDDRSGRWMPGPELYLMGTVAASRYDITGIARDIVRSLAVRTEESAFLSVRRGDETVCLLREEGSFPIRSFVLSEGVRFPLGVASAGLAILAFLPPHDVDAYFERHPELGHGVGFCARRAAPAHQTPRDAGARLRPQLRADRRGQLWPRRCGLHEGRASAVGTEPDRAWSSGSVPTGCPSSAALSSPTRTS